MESVTQRTRSAADAPRPQTTAPASVFDAGKQAKAAATAPRAKAFDPMAVPIKKGVPIPDSQAPGRGIDRYAELAKRMEVGDCVELPHGQANSLAAKAAKKFGHKMTKRKISDTLTGVWRRA